MVWFQWFVSREEWSATVGLASLSTAALVCDTARTDGRLPLPVTSCLSLSSFGQGGRLICAAAGRGSNSICILSRRGGMRA